MPSRSQDRSVAPRADRDADQLGRIDALPVQELAQPHPDLVRGPIGVGREPPAGHQLGAPEQPHHGVRVADIQHQQQLAHGSHPHRRGSTIVRA